MPSYLPHLLALHELDPVFRRVTLENDRLKALARDLRFHHDPLGEDTFGPQTQWALTYGRKHCNQ